MRAAVEEGEGVEKLYLLTVRAYMNLIYRLNFCLESHVEMLKTVHNDFLTVIV